MDYGNMIVSSIVLGTLARFWMLKVDYRQYPGYPHGYAVHLSLGFIAASLGALALPALLDGDFAAVTFLVLAAKQFSNIREMERTYLLELENTELVKRGSAYVEGIAQVFEARNYLAMLVALVASIGVRLFELPGGIALAIIAALVLQRAMQGQTVKDIAEVEVVDLEFQGDEGENIAIGDVVLMNVGEEEIKEDWQKLGIGISIKPKDDNARATLANKGQRQAILHDVVSQLGVRLDVGVVGYTPLARLDLDTGRVYIMIIPIEPDEEFVKKAVENTPVLESSRRKPLQSEAGRLAAD
ncbi:YIEGIA family protein [Fuchsiella alkaliacetigena]|uniref:YIEGIA family protein n=1 Tax=Fuchsiella alkaliacetigena TaxID=957042 RepID=UPI00200BA126|nr:YIEGIA family protein [Fuchsiella alkaliacetigena]MCK8823932.1 YIEGIA family protein [Fuchsiella alkaliacetigena]